MTKKLECTFVRPYKLYNTLLNFRWDVQNNTWAMAEALRPLVLNFEFKRNGKTAYITTGFPGFVGAFTGFIPVS